MGAGFKTTIQRHKERAVDNADALVAVLDEAMVAHVSFIDDGLPYVIPMVHVRIGGYLYVHGSPHSRAMRCLLTGIPCSVAVTLLDGIVCSRTPAGHSLNYRSALIHGSMADVPDADKRGVFEALVEHLAAGRLQDVLPLDEADVTGTALGKIALDTCSFKVRAGGPVDAKADRDQPVWGGYVPLSLAAGMAVADPGCEDLPVPSSVIAIEGRFPGPGTPSEGEARRRDR